MPRAIDHLVLATRDLDQTADLYRRMGFTIGARNRHAWGTLNHIVQLGGNFLELIATEPGFVAPAEAEPVWQFAGFLDRYVRRREGLAMLVLGSQDAVRDAQDFEQAGIGAAPPFFFERQGKRADGTPVHVAFTLAFAQSPLVSEAGFFVCQQHFPEAFWSPALQRHENGAVRVAAVTLAALDPTALFDLLHKFSGAPAKVTDGGLSFACDNEGRIEVVTPDAARTSLGFDVEPAAGGLPRFAGYRIAVSNLSRTRACLAANGVGFVQCGPSIIVNPREGRGAGIAFEQV